MAQQALKHTNAAIEWEEPEKSPKTHNGVEQAQSNASLIRM